MASVTDTAERMDRIYAAQRHIYDATRKYYLLGRDHLIDGLAPSEGARILEVGCGTGRNLIRAARRHPRAQLFGIDISRQMLASADIAIAKAALPTPVKTAWADATHFDPAALFAEDSFDCVFFSYSLSMIPGWHRALEQALAVLTPGGSLHIVDFGDQNGLPAWFRDGLRAWLARFSVSPRGFLKNEVEDIAIRHRGRLTFAQPYRGYVQYAVLRLPTDELERRPGA